VKLLLNAADVVAPELNEMTYMDPAEGVGGLLDSTTRLSTVLC
jgi:hypothetical protein